MTAVPAWKVDGPGAVLAAEPAPPPEIHLTIERGQLTLAARDVPLADVIRAIGEAGRFKVTIEGEIDARVTRSFARTPLEEGIRQLIGDAATVMIYGPSQDGAAPRTLAEIKLYEASGERVAPAQRSAQVAAEQSILPDLARLDPAARAGTLRRLALEQGEAAVGALVKVLTEDEDATVRVEAVDTLGELAARPGTERSAAALATALADDESAVRLRAARALSKVGGSGAVEALAATLADDPDGRVRQMAAWTLGKIHTERAAIALELAAESDPLAAVRRTARSSLQHWED